MIVVNKYRTTIGRPVFLYHRRSRYLNYELRITNSELNQRCYRFHDESCELGDELFLSDGFVGHAAALVQCLLEIFLDVGNAVRVVHLRRALEMVVQ